MKISRTVLVALAAALTAWADEIDLSGTWQMEGKDDRGEFDDNAFTLLPGVKKTIVFKAKEPLSPEGFAAKATVASLAEPGSPTSAITESGLPKVKLGDVIADGLGYGRVPRDHNPR